MDYNDIINKMNSVDESFLNKWTDFIQSWSIKTLEKYLESEDKDFKPHLSYKIVQTKLKATSEPEKSACIGFVASWIAVNRDRHKKGEDPYIITSDVPDELFTKAYMEIASRDKKSGCFIATAVYGDYDSPEVMVLRKWRDTVLNRTIFGKIIIRIYYKVSPPLTPFINRNKIILKTVRNLLDKLINLIKG